MTDYPSAVGISAHAALKGMIEIGMEGEMEE
jgi:hypothetical protein